MSDYYTDVTSQTRETALRVCVGHNSEVEALNLRVRFFFTSGTQILMVVQFQVSYRSQLQPWAHSTK